MIAEKIDKKIELEENKSSKTKSKFYTYLLIFFVASIIGWIYEVIFYKATENILVNRGFLYGPYVPVYGTGAVLLVLLLKPFKKNPIVLFLASMLITGVLEYFTGWLMYLIWQRNWWDYTGLFMSIDGYVCLRSVISFAIGGIALIYFLEPYINKFVASKKNKTLNFISVSIIALMSSDLILSLLIRNPII